MLLGDLGFTTSLAAVVCFMLHLPGEPPQWSWLCWRLQHARMLEERGWGWAQSLLQCLSGLYQFWEQKEHTLMTKYGEIKGLTSWEDTELSWNALQYGACRICQVQQRWEGKTSKEEAFTQPGKGSGGWVRVSTLFIASSEATGEFCTFLLPLSAAVYGLPTCKQCLLPPW